MARAAWRYSSGRAGGAEHRLAVIDPATGAITTTLVTLASGQRFGGLGIDATRTLLLYNVSSTSNLEGPLYALSAAGGQPVPVAGGRLFTSAAW